jgi:predicted nucleic acid-binding protein
VIVVDTSVWIAAFRSRASREAGVLEALLDADEVALPVPVRIEILSGASRSERPKLRRVLSALPSLYPTDDTWHRLDEWTDRTSRAGDRFGVGDLLIAQLCAEAGALLWSLDSDFKRLARLKLIELYEPARLS